MAEPKTIYVAEDDEPVRELIRLTLEAAGFAVETGGTGRLSPERLRARGCAAVLLDVRMPGETGLDALRTLKQSADTADTPVLMLTGDNRFDRIAEAMRLGASGYLMKPFEPQELVDRVRALVTA